MFGLLAQAAADSGDDVDVITTTSEAPRTVSAEELNAQLKAAGGSLIISATDSRFIVARNNGLRFSLTRLSDGRYRVTASSMFPLLIAGAVVLGVLFIARG